MIAGYMRKKLLWCKLFQTMQSRIPWCSFPALDLGMWTQGSDHGMPEMPGKGLSRGCQGVLLQGLVADIKVFI